MTFGEVIFPGSFCSEGPIYLEVKLLNLSLVESPIFLKKLGKTEAQSVLYGKFKNYDTQIIFKTANSLIWAKSGLKGLIKFYLQKFYISSKTGPILIAQPA